MDSQKKASQGMELLKDSILDVIKERGSAGITEVARSVRAFNFDCEKINHKGWFVSNLFALLVQEGKIHKVGKKWYIKDNVK